MSEQMWGGGEEGLSLWLLHFNNVCHLLSIFIKDLLKISTATRDGSVDLVYQT